MPQKNLILITSNFPFEKRETFLEQEIPVLCNHFNKVYIIAQDNQSDTCRHIPSNCKTFRLDSNLTKAELLPFVLKSIFSKAFFIELFNILFIYKRMLSISILKNLLYTISTGIKINKFIRKVIKDEKIQYKNIIFYSYWLDKGAFAISAFNIPKKQCFAISRAHGFDVYEWRSSNNYLPLKKHLYNKLNSIYFISENGEKYFEKTYKINDIYKRKLKISRLGTINHHGYNKTFKKNEEFILVSCSGIIKLKNIDKIIEALSLIDNINIRWFHIGDNIDNPELEINMKEFALQKLRNKKNIQYTFTGRFSNLELMDFYLNNNIDAFINVSSTEGLPVTIMEAMSFGIPVIAPEIGAIAEIVNSTNGILLTSNSSIEEIVDAISEIYNFNDSEMSAMRYCAFNIWKDNYNAEENYERFAEEISNL